jgi:hypothetical protein
MTCGTDERTERLARELESAFRNRADLYRLMLEELTGAFGAEKAEAMLSRVVARRGGEVAATAFAGFDPGDARSVGEAFLAVSPDGGRMYPTDVTRRTDGITFRVKRCPLKDAWCEADLDAATVATLCRIAGEFDRALFEEIGVGFENETWREGREGCCTIHLTDAAGK